MRLIEPRNLKGFRDYLPEEQIARAKMINEIRQVFELYGFEPLETPVLEHEDILAGKYGEEGERLMYRFKDNGGRDVAMRYDLTVPTARVAAQYRNELPNPFKRYQIAPVWRAENPQRGRYREFYQADADIIGSEIGLPDAECIAMIEKILLNLGIKKFKIKVSNRKILNAIMITAGLSPGKILAAIREIDKIEKIGADAVAHGLEQLGMNRNQAEGLIRLAATKVPDVGALKTFMSRHILKVEQGKEGFAELNEIFTALKEFGTRNVEIDLSLARGLDYYTSTIVEANITESRESMKFGSVVGAGRYDNLLKLFTGKDIPAVGISVGIDRIFSALSELGLIKKKGVIQVLILNIDDRLRSDYLRLLADLREHNIKSELYYKRMDIKKQFAYAEKKSIPYAIIFGENEKNKGEVTVRNLISRKQYKYKRKDLISNLNKLFLKS